MANSDVHMMAASAVVIAIVVSAGGVVTFATVVSSPDPCMVEVTSIVDPAGLKIVVPTTAVDCSPDPSDVLLASGVVVISMDCVAVISMDCVAVIAMDCVVVAIDGVVEVNIADVVVPATTVITDAEV